MYVSIRENGQAVAAVAAVAVPHARHHPQVPDLRFTSPGLEKTSPGLEKTSPGLVKEASKTLAERMP